MAAARQLKGRFLSSSTVFYPQKSPLLLKDHFRLPRATIGRSRARFFLHLPRYTRSLRLCDYRYAPYIKLKGGTSVNPPFDLTKEFVRFPRYGRDATVCFKHQRCNTHTTRRVDKKALERGFVVIRCRGCDDLVAVANHFNCFDDGTHESVEKFLRDFLYLDVPPEGSSSTVCVTFESWEWVSTEGVKLQKERTPGVSDIYLPLYEDLGLIPSVRRRVKPQSGTNRGSHHRAQPGTNGGNNLEEESGSDGGINLEEEGKSTKSKKKKSQEITNKFACESKNNNSDSSRPESNPEFVLVKNGGINSRAAQQRTNGGSSSEAQSGTNRRSIPKGLSKTNGGSNPKAQSGTSRGSSHKVQSEINEGKHSTPQPGMQDGSRAKQSGTNGGSIPKVQPRSDGGSNTKEQSGASGRSNAKEEQMNKYEDHHEHIESEDLQLELDTSYQERPVQILDRKERVLTNTISFVKILWNHHDKFEASWELEDDMCQLYPEFFSS